MKKILATIMLLVIILVGVCCISTTVNAEKQAEEKDEQTTLTEVKEKAENGLESYKEKYGSDAYGITAYILNLVRIYSIPFCFLGIIVSGINQYVIGIRRLDKAETGLKLMVTFITLFVICQILPLAFAIVVKFGRG